MDWIMDHFAELVQAAGLVITAASALAALTPTPVDDGIAAFLRKAVDLLALNVGYARKDK